MSTICFSISTRQFRTNGIPINQKLLVLLASASDISDPSSIVLDEKQWAHFYDIVIMVNRVSERASVARVCDK